MLLCRRISRLLRLLLLALSGCGAADAAEVATFNVSNFVALTLNDSGGAVLTAEFELRTSHSAWAVWGIAQLTPSSNGNATYDQLLKLRLTPDNLTADWNDSSVPISAGLTDGNWHSIRIRLDNYSGVSVSVDAVNASIVGPWSPLATATQLVMTFGGVNGTGGLRGCLANASVDDNVTTVQVKLLGGGGGGGGGAASLGCLEDPCMCANAGRCLPRSQWNLHAGCNCTGTAYQGPFCHQAIDVCASDPNWCNGHGLCTSVPERATFVCNCTGWLGSRCQSPDPCLPQTDVSQAACNGHGNCSVLGDQELPGNLTRLCKCSAGYGGSDCSVAPASGTAVTGDTRIVVGLVVGLFLLLLAGTAAGLTGKLVRDRRKDTGVYKPSDRELGGKGAAHSLQGVLHPPTEERLI